MITYNDPSTSKERSETKPLSLQEEMQVIEMLNNTDYSTNPLLQRFVNHYQNMSHYVAYTGGLWATDVPDKITDPENVLFQIKF